MEEVERFITESDTGERHTVVLWATVVEFQDSKGVLTRGRGGTELRLLDGRDVTPKQPGVFQILDTDEIIRQINN